MKKLLVIEDPAHGLNKDKGSPDGVHSESVWSRARWDAIRPRLVELGYTIESTNTSVDEIGLLVRKSKASDIARKYSELVPLLISIHNNGDTSPPEWQNYASGIQVHTSKGRTTSDIFADYFIQNISNFLPEVNKRLSSQTYLDRDFEDNFTVLMGAYSAILIEVMFQDNKDDVAKLTDPAFCKKVEDWIVDSIEKCNEYITTNKL